jgi:hypothetical protein
LPLASTGETVHYGREFFSSVAEGSRRSADEVVSLIFSLFAPNSIVDVGGGAGHWAAAFLELGLHDVLTIDGPWVPRTARVIPADRFLEHDLSRPLTLNRNFDLALCLEAAEHLPASAAPGLVKALTETAPVVVFSAALPGQGGDGHINERLPSYWADLFAVHGYVCYSDLRTRIWNEEAVEVWYRQNLLCFIRRSELHRWRDVLKEPRKAGSPLLDIAHPDLVLRHKLRADRLESYAQRLEQDLQQARSDLASVERARVWRAWQKVSRAIQGLRKINPLTSPR